MSGWKEERAAAERAFLKAAGWAGADVAPLAGDASNRSYRRLTGGPGGEGAVLMDAPAERGEDIRPFLTVTGWLRRLGLSAPEIYGADVDAGFALIEDLGDALFARVCRDDPSLEEGCYAAATDLLASLAAAPPPERMAACGVETALAPYDSAVLMREALLFSEWWLPAATGAPLSNDMEAEFSALLLDATAPVAGARGTVVLRDYHAENLLWLPERSGDARVGLLDYQDALAGSDAYDLVSLLEDARRDVSPALAERMLARRIAATGADDGAFRAAYALLGAQRNLKIIGIFSRLWRRDGKPLYLDLIPRVWAHLCHDLAHPDLAALRAFIMRHAPVPDAATLARVRGAR